MRFRNVGFTLIELMITLVIISILSVAAVSRVQDDGGYAEYTYQARFISAARHLQTRAMQHTQSIGYCYQININSGLTPWFSAPDLSTTYADCTSTPAHQWQGSSQGLLVTTDTTEMQQQDVQLLITDFSGNDITADVASLRFDSLGRGYYQGLNTAGLQCVQGCKVIFRGETDAAVCIEAEGYIHAC